MEKDIVVRIEELMDLFDDDEVTTADKIERPQSALDRDAIRDFNIRNPKAGGGRIGFKKGLSVDLYNSLINEYTDLLDEGVKNNKLINAPSWESFVTSKGYKTASLTYYADKPAPTKLLKEKKLELANKLIDAENLKLNGITKGAGEGASSIFQGKITNNRIGHLSKSIEGDLSRLVNKNLDTRKDKINKAFNYIMNPDYKMSTKGNTGVAHEIQKLIAPNTTKGRITKEIRLVLDTIPEYKAAEDKFKYINRILSKVPTGTDTSMGYLMEMAENNKLGKANFEDWWKLAGDKPEQFAMREVMRNWNNAKGKGDFKLYDLNGEEIIWKGKDNKISINKILFSYADPDDLGYKNKLYSFFKPDEKTLAKINMAVPNEGVFDLKGNIRNLDEFNELVEVVDGRNKLFNTEMIDPFTGEKSTYKKVYENIYKNIKTTAYGTKEGYTKSSAMAGHIDHEFGTKKYPFNNLRISTGQQNQMFSALANAAENNEALKPYVRALEAEIYTGGSVDDQIKAIVNETNELGKIVKNAPGKITIPTATETAAFKFLKNEIPGIPESVINYLQPKAEAAEKILQETPELKKLIATLGGGNCGRGFKNQGGRVGLKDGPINLDVCFQNATNRINSGFKNATKAEAKNYTKLLNIVKGSATIGKNLLKFGIVPEALFVGADSLIRVGLGDTFEEAGLRASDYLLPGDQTKEADILKVQRTIGDMAATNVGKVLDYRNQLAKINSLEQQKQSAEALSPTSGFDYLPDRTEDIKNIDMRLNEEKTNLQNKFMVSEAETVAADRALEEAYDISKAKSPFAKFKLFAKNLGSYEEDPFSSDVIAPEKTQAELNLDMFPTMPREFLTEKTSDLLDRTQALKQLGYDVSTKDLMEEQERLRSLPLSEYVTTYGPEQVYGTQGTFFGQPLAGGGIAGLSGGVKSGPPPEKGPNPQGLPSLLKRVRNI